MQMIICHIETINTIDDIIQSLEHDSMMLFKWFSDN